MNTQTVILSIVLISLFFYFTYERIRYGKWLEKEAKASAERFNKQYRTDFTHFEFARINQRNPDWLSLESSKQRELLEKHGYIELAYMSCL